MTLCSEKHMCGDTLLPLPGKWQQKCLSQGDTLSGTPPLSRIVRPRFDQNISESCELQGKLEPCESLCPCHAYNASNSRAAYHGKPARGQDTLQMMQPHCMPEWLQIPKFCRGIDTPPWSDCLLANGRQKRTLLTSQIIANPRPWFLNLKCIWDDIPRDPFSSLRCRHLQKAQRIPVNTEFYA